MAAYAVALLSKFKAHPEVVEYLSRIDATMEPYGGKWAVHGATLDVRDGPFNGRFVFIEFPTIEKAQDGYDSKEY